MSAGASRLVLTVAGSDSSGGAGILADLRAIAGAGCAGAVVVTAVTAQGSRGVLAQEPVSVELVRAQLGSALDELQPAAIKTGMLATAEIVRAVVDEIRRWPRRPLVCDPVARSTSGHDLLSEPGLAAMREALLPLATLVTPNAEEARLLTGITVRTPAEAEDAGHALLTSGADAVLVTGGHFDTERGTDVLVTGEGVRRFSAPPIDAPDARGTGCTLSAVIACALARGEPLEDAVEAGRAAVRERIRS